MNSTTLSLPGFDELEPPASAKIKAKSKKTSAKEASPNADSFFVAKKAKTRPFVARGKLALSRIKTETIDDIYQCEKLWDEFSPKRIIFDTWEFRRAFNDAYKYKPHFVVFKHGKENVGLMPLCFNTDKQKYVWFGTEWQEEVDFMAKKPELIPLMVSVAPKPLILNAIAHTSVSAIPKEEADKLFAVDDPKYILDISNFKSHEDYLMTIKKNERRNLRKDCHKVERMSPKIIIDRFNDLDKLVDICVTRFTQKGEDTDWDDQRRIDAFKNVIKNTGKSYKIRMITIEVQGKAVGVDLIATYNDTYFALKCGYDVYSCPGIGNYMNMFEINDALKLGAKKIDFLQSSYQWKDKFFKPTQLFQHES